MVMGNKQAPDKPAMHCAAQPRITSLFVLKVTEPSVSMEVDSISDCFAIIAEICR